MEEIYYTKSYYRGKRRSIHRRDEVLADKVLDLVNLAGAGLVFGQFISRGGLNIIAFFFGLSFILVGYLWSWYYLSKFE